eukprot:CAMPEP_0172305732 /NCGR_PEP_ID=MMETSP1058-20130122/6971_1 /TAXON_ID=83371 /ORGANISM="Detonula confervacea, Strain CCMP 353" /LENGTH=608 /DNA_ID=CAMNT_0013017429 /DNA_START=160 /DNA_END=1986 /DNA_ORIENTATION=+
MIVTAALLLLLIVAISTIIAGMLAMLPGRLDEFLLTNDDYCYQPTLENGGGGISSRRGQQQPSVQVDYGEYKPKMMQDKSNYYENAQPSLQKKQQQHLKKGKYHVSNSILWRMALHLWEPDDDDSMEATACPIHNKNEQQILQSHGQKNELHWENSNEENARSRRLHPMCQGYRRFRSRLRFQQLLIPWNWYYRNHFSLRGLTLSSLADNVAFVSRKDNVQPPWWMFGYYNLHPDGNAARVNAVPRRAKKNHPAEQQPEEHDNSVSHLPPSLEIETLDISFQSWTKPIVSAHARGIMINIVIQKGEFSFPLQMSSNGPRKVANNTALLIGDMTIPEVLKILPEPPEKEGLFPRIGIVNITNVTLCVFENKVNNGSPLILLLKMRVPDKFFLPITNLTLAHKQTGIDQKHFQHMMESSISNALRGHLLREATAAFRNSWVSANKAQEQFNHFVLQMQELYLDRWIGMGLQAWHQTQENVWKGVVNGTAPLVRAVEDWVIDFREIVSEPVHPLAVVFSHYRNRTMGGINKHGISIDKQIWGHFNELVVTKVKVNHFKHEKKKPKHLVELRVAFDRFIAKSGQEIDLLVKSCELEVKEIWLAWHLQFMPDL